MPQKPNFKVRNTGNCSSSPKVSTGFTSVMFHMLVVTTFRGPNFGAILGPQISRNSGLWPFSQNVSTGFTPVLVYMSMWATFLVISDKKQTKKNKDKVTNVQKRFVFKRLGTCHWFPSNMKFISHLLVAEVAFYVCDTTVDLGYRVIKSVLATCCECLRYDIRENCNLNYLPIQA